MSPQSIGLIALVAGVAVIWLWDYVAAAIAWATSKATGGSGKPTRDAAVQAYDTLKAYLGDDADLKAIWGKLS